MEEKQLSQDCNRKRIKQPVSVPFLWEEKPGTPKKDWKPSFIPVNPITPPPPIKLIASVPFEWEEKPGKPLAFFPQQPQLVSAILVPPTKIANFTSLVHSQENDDECKNSANGDDERDEMVESEHDAWGFETDESFSSAPSLLANRLLPSGHLQTPSSPASETDSSTSSYATGTTSLVGAPFLECLFPLLSPNSSFLEKVGCSEKGSSHTPQKAESKDLNGDSNRSVVIKRPVTLGELIMMSRRRSYRRKAVQMKEHSLSMEFMKRSAFGCCIFGNINGIRGLQGKLKRQLQLKLM